MNIQSVSSSRLYNRLQSVNGLLRCSAMKMTSPFPHIIKTFLSCKSFPLQPFFFFFRTDYMIPQILLLLLSISVFIFYFFSVSHFLVVVSVR